MNQNQYKLIGFMTILSSITLMFIAINSSAIIKANIGFILFNLLVLIKSIKVTTI